MTRPVILTAGRATRAGDLAPYGCKSLVPLQGIPVIEWQLAAMKRAGCVDPVIVCRTEHAHLLDQYGTVVTNDACDGAGGALLSAMSVTYEAVVVAYADTFFTDIPRGIDWVGVAEGAGGRNWYVLHEDDDKRWLRYEYVPEGETATVGVGLFHFSNAIRLKASLLMAHGKDRYSKETGLDTVANIYEKWVPADIPSWQDVGDGNSIESWTATPWQD